MTEPITDQELAAMDKRRWGGPIELHDSELARLICALRVSRAENERLEAEINERDRIVYQAFRVDL